MTFESIFGLPRAPSFDSLDNVLMNPVLGLHAIVAIARFSWALAALKPACRFRVKLIFERPATARFVDTPRRVRRCANGNELSQALDEARLFPEEYLSLVQVAEASGTVPETLERLSPQFEEQARRSLAALAIMMGWLVWSIVAVFIIFIIFSFVMKYVGMINAAASGNLDDF